VKLIPVVSFAQRAPPGHVEHGSGEVCVGRDECGRLLVVVKEYALRQLDDADVVAKVGGAKVGVAVGLRRDSPKLINIAVWQLLYQLGAVYTCTNKGTIMRMISSMICVHT
jgi:hypothetical protein